MWFAAKIFLSGVIIAYASWLSGRKPVLAGFIISLPIMSMLSIIFSYAEYRDMEKINRFVSSIFTAVPLSLTFFVPFLLNRWLRWNFPVTYAAAVACTALAYLVHRSIFKAGL